MAGAQHGGAEAFFERLVPALHEAGAPQRAVIRQNHHRASLLRNYHVLTTETQFRGGLMRYLDWTTPRHIAREIAAFDPKIVFGWMNRGASALPIPQAGFTTVGRLGGYYDLRYYRNCDYLVANTKDLIRYILSKGWPASRAVYKPNFVDVQDFPAEPRYLHGTPEDAFLILGLGRLHTNKGFDVLIEALVNVPGAYLWLAGVGPLELELRHQVEVLGLQERVRFLGWRNDTAALYAAADVFVCPSRHEPLGNVMLEAWAAHKAVLAARAQGPMEMITHGKNGMLVDIDQADQMARSLVDLKEDLAKRHDLAAAGHAYFKEHFTRERVVTDYLTFFEEIAPTCVE